ncbi:mRNA surveillance protein pelota [Candidatus Bathyarchaeota archaeon]|nr:MAG: mRNA surveillance protein pelota [Candidatus Bathyarchaeota archaeon]
MKIIKRDIKHGKITVIPEMLDDLWTLYNVITKGDIVYARTTREVRYGERYNRPEKGKRISAILGLRVENVRWDRSLNRLRIHGIIRDSPDEIGALGSHHTINVELNKPLTIIKERWEKYQLERLRKATKVGISPLIVASIDDEGYCIAVIRNFNIEVKSEGKLPLPGKSRVESRRRAIQNLFSSAYKALREVWATERNPIVILGLGFIKNSFTEYLKDKDPDLTKSIIDVKGVHSTGISGINEALRSGILKKALKHLRIAEEIEAVEEVLTRIGKGKNDVAYGLKEVECAASIGAIDKLLITDTQLREATDEERLEKEELIRKVEGKGGRIIIISTEHEAGMKLHSLGGVAALLRFPLKY